MHNAREVEAAVERLLAELEALIDAVADVTSHPPNDEMSDRYLKAHQGFREAFIRIIMLIDFSD